MELLLFKLFKVQSKLADLNSQQKQCNKTCSSGMGIKYQNYQVLSHNCLYIYIKKNSSRLLSHSIYDT